METMELFYPQIIIRIGQYSFTQGITLKLCSSRDSCFDWAKLRFTSEYQPKISIARKDPASIQLGYNGVFQEVFTGYVAQPYSVGSADEILLKDEMLLLEETLINNTFVETTPQEMISYFLSQAGVTRLKLSQKAYPERRQLSICRMNAIQAINAVNGAWGLKYPFYFSGGVFYWEEKPDQAKVYSFERGVNILSLSRSGGVWELETVSAPFIRHSNRIDVVHPQISGSFEIAKTVFSTNDDGFIRTKLYF